MSDKFKKIDKEFVITDNSVNVYKYRCLTEGFQLDEVLKNPIGFKMHNREGGVVVRWEDFRIEGDRVLAKPVINLSHPDGEKIASEVESGFLNAASVGKIVVLESSNAKDLKLPKQTGPTVTKWFPREISLVDIPGNYNALASLYDQELNELNLSDFIENLNTNEMAQPEINVAKLLTALNLSDTAEENEALETIQDLIDRAGKYEEAKADLDAKDQELEDLKAESVKKEVQDLIAKGKADKKVTNELGEKLEKQYAENPVDLKDLIDALPAQVSVVDEVKKDSIYEGKTWDDLYASGELETVKKEFPDLYENLKNTKYPNLKQD